MAKRTLPRLLQTPAVVLLLIWMLVPLSMTLYFSFIRYVLVNFRKPEWATPSLSNWRGFGNYKYVLEAKDFWMAIQNSVLIVSSGRGPGHWLYAGNPGRNPVFQSRVVCQN